MSLIDLILYRSARVFKDYMYAWSFLALTVTIVFFSALKYVLIYYSPKIAASENVRGFFQLSFLFFIPLLFMFIFTKFRLKKYTEATIKEKNPPYSLSLISVIAISILLVILFTYTLMIW